MGASWSLLGLSWAARGRSWGALGRSLVALGRFGAALGHSWAVLGRSGIVLGQFCSLFRGSLVDLGGSWGPKRSPNPYKNLPKMGLGVYFGEFLNEIRKNLENIEKYEKLTQPAPGQFLVVFRFFGGNLLYMNFKD